MRKQAGRQINVREEVENEKRKLRKIKNKEIGQKWLKKKQQQCNRNTNNDRKDVGREKDNSKKEKDSTVK